MTTKTINRLLTPSVLGDIAGKLASGVLAAKDIIGFDLGAALKKKPADDRPAFADDPVALRAFEIEYTKFFLLMAANPDSPVVPTVDQDDWGWHIHLHKPVAYAEACQAWAGAIIDHEGGFGLGEGEWPVLQGYFEMTKALWKAAYGEPHPAAKSDAALCHKICKSCHSRSEEATCFKATDSALCHSKCVRPPQAVDPAARGVALIAATCFKIATAS